MGGTRRNWAFISSAAVSGYTSVHSDEDFCVTEERERDGAFIDKMNKLVFERCIIWIQEKRSEAMYYKKIVFLYWPISVLIRFFRWTFEQKCANFKQTSVNFAQIFSCSLIKNKWKFTRYMSTFIIYLKSKKPSTAKKRIFIYLINKNYFPYSYK